ncbi:exopolysaccharide biosynthesis polyprenyl glycosylphosphotransferase [Haloferula sp. A504]|uniref:exopolysaccharide biosynthesis polyprenyl glycosylphosphotransferase n=1 Tax=Haloferula sp. A504 TaxID=3373601 RepID=UPI0031C34740|nr:exopolysaccharide biosynthesis polyprenyl glycosylphosphotransferase [Verrucomicrobiaceae bacterium E54]
MKTAIPPRDDAAPASCPPIQPPAEATYSLRHRHRSWVAHQKLVALSFLGDAAIVLFAMLAAYLVRFESHLAGIGVGDETIDFNSYLGHVILGAVLLQFLLANFRAHDPRHFLAIRRTLQLIAKSCAIWFAVFLGLTLTLKLEPAISRVYCVLATGFALMGLGGWRWFLYCVMRREPIASTLRQKVVFVGWNSECERSVERFSEGRAHRYAVAGVVLPQEPDARAKVPGSVPVLGTINEVRTIIRDTGADIVMAVDSALERDAMLDLAETCGKEFVDFKLVPSCFQVLLSGLQFESIHGMPVLGVGRLPLHHAFNNVFKRTVDIVGALVGLLLFGPVIALFSALVYLESPGAVIYRQRRIGLNGRPFDILKIRSMKPDAERGGSPGWTVKDDPRRLKVGAFMRRWNIDELPQFWNVLRGEMSLVGPRPERPELIEGFKEQIRHYNVRHNVKPGLTGWAQIHGFRGDTCLRERVKFDLDYIENWSALLDFQIMLLTFFKRKGAC